VVAFVAGSAAILLRRRVLVMPCDSLVPTAADKLRRERGADCATHQFADCGILHNALD
jgi:hypothetical protein